MSGCPQFFRMNVMEINGIKAVIAFDPEINMFRGEFVGLFHF
jgi:predicted HicB family RNase H-like nuclease